MTMMMMKAMKKMLSMKIKKKTGEERKGEKKRGSWVRADVLPNT